MRERWDPPVCLRLGGDEDVTRVSNVFEATHILLYRWPAVRGDAYHNAWQQCVRALKGATKPGRARRALVEAAREAAILDE